MTYPPPPGGPPYPPPQGGAPGPYGPPPQQQWPQPQQQWAPQPQWAPGPPPKKRGNGWKWGLGAVALLAIIGVTAAVSISVTRGGGEGDPTTPAGNDVEMASANDKGPVGIVTDEPTCGAWTPINTALAKAQRNGWDKIDRSIPASAWSQEQRTQYDSVAQAMRDASDQTVRLVRVTPHRVIRQLYEQFIAYARAYSDSVPRYQPVDNYLATVVADTSSALASICTTINYGSAQAWAPLVPEANSPEGVAEPQDPNNPQRFMPSPDPTCGDWERLLRTFEADTVAWDRIDPNKPASEWSSEQKSIGDSLIPILNRFADDIVTLAHESGSGTLADFAVLAAQYRRAFAQALPTYSPADSYLAGVAVDLTNTIFDACKAVGS